MITALIDIYEWLVEVAHHRRASDWPLPAEAPPNPNEKLSNPKDAVGVRKAPMSTVPATVTAEVGVAMLEGACKYGRHNYRAVGVRAAVYYDAANRHLRSWWEGEDIDPASGIHHVAKAIASLVVLRDAMIQGMLTDDRPPPAPEGFFDSLDAKAASIIDLHADKAPHHYTRSDECYSNLSSAPSSE